MYPILYNKCFVQQTEDSTIHFYFSSCEHVLCESCVNTHCPICSRPYDSIKICKVMPAEMAAFFVKGPELYSDFQRSMKFQIEQDMRMFKHHYETLPAMVKKLQKECRALVKVEKQISTALSVGNQRIAKLKKHLTYTERLVKASVNSIPRNHPPVCAAFKGRARLVRSAPTSRASSITGNCFRGGTPTLSVPDSEEEGCGNNE